MITRISASIHGGLLLLLVSMLLISCIEFDTFERIEDDKPRVIGVQHEPKADFAPGDTVITKIFFAGDTVMSISNFSLAYKHEYDRNHTFPDERTISVLDTTLWLPDSAQFRFVIPADVFQKEHFFGTSDTSLVNELVTLITTHPDPENVILANQSNGTYLKYYTLISQLYARPNIFFHAQSIHGADLKIKTDFVIRYNSKFPLLFPINTNPSIKWIGIYKVKDGISSTFHPNNPDYKGKFELFYLYNAISPEKQTDTISIEKNYSYFISSNSQIDFSVQPNGDTLKDTVCDFIEIDTLSIPEPFNYKYFFQNLDKTNEEPDSLLMIDENNSNIVKLNPPVYKSMKHFKIWLVLYDSYDAEWNRPRGCDIQSVKGVFKYGDGYGRN
ncbi:MAG: hypothetical protein GX639_00235 [Fibrobacter sp.]|nr:hypothetical protein [Fibrobacter sp.]